MRHPESVFFGLGVGNGETPGLAILVQAGGRLALECVTPLADPAEISNWIRPWRARDVAMAFCADAPLTHDFAGPAGERRIERLYRRLAPVEFEGPQRVRLSALKSSGLRALRAANIAHELGVPIAETHPRASLARLGARDPGWIRAASQYTGAEGVPEGIVRERCHDLWIGLIDKLGVEDARTERTWPTPTDVNALLCAMAARALIRPDAGVFSQALEPGRLPVWGPRHLRPLGACVRAEPIKFSRCATEKSRMSDSGNGTPRPQAPAGAPTAKQKIAEHRFTKTVRSWLSEGGVDLKAVETVRENGCVWKLTGGEGLSLFLAVYIPDSGGVPFYHLEAALSALKPESETEALRWLLITHNKFPSPFRLALEPEGYVVLQSRAPCDEVSADYFLWMLNSLIPIADDLLKELSSRFRLRPFSEVLKGQQQQKKSG